MGSRSAVDFCPSWKLVNRRWMPHEISPITKTRSLQSTLLAFHLWVREISGNCIRSPYSLLRYEGVYLTTLTFIQEGSKDKLPGNLINFGKRQRAAEVIREIQHWQSKDYNLAPLTPVLAYIEDALNSFGDNVKWEDQFYNLSLEREPREREDEKMARLLQESGFL